MSWFKTKVWNGFLGVSDGGQAVLVIVALVVLLAHLGAIITFLAVRGVGLQNLRLHYTAVFGVDWVDAWWKMLTFPVFGAAAFFVNGYFSGILARRHRLYAVTLMYLTLVLEVMLAGGGLSAILLNV